MTEGITLTPAPYVSIKHAALMIGMPESSIRQKIDSGAWVQGKQYHRTQDGEIKISMNGFAQWVESGYQPSRQAKPGNDIRTTALYRHYDKHGALLYVGISLSAVMRLQQHQASDWSKRIANVTIEHFGSRAEAEHAETLAIQTEGPIFNKAKRQRMDA